MHNTFFMPGRWSARPSHTVPDRRTVTRFLPFVRPLWIFLLLQGASLALADPVQIGFKSPVYSAVENAGYVSLDLDAWGGSYPPEPVTVLYSTHDGTATGGKDYVVTTGQLD